MPDRPHLSDPGGSARMPYGGSAERGRPVFALQGGEGGKAWKVEVVPLLGGGAKGLGADLAGGRQKPRATFEIRADYIGIGLPEFGSHPNTRRIETFHTEEEGLARAIATRAAELLRTGQRDILLNKLAGELARR